MLSQVAHGTPELSTPATLIRTAEHIAGVDTDAVVFLFNSGSLLESVALSGATVVTDRLNDEHCIVGAMVRGIVCH